MKHINALSIAGTDPSGGAGIQADLKTFSALRAYGASVITALVAQNTCGVQSIYNIDPNFIGAQLDAVFSDMHIDTTKIGMLANSAIIKIVSDKLLCYKPRYVVLDPVMLAKSGDALLAPEAMDALKKYLLPLVSLVTPNLPEAAVLLNCSPAKNEEQMCEQGLALLHLGCKNVLMKGGHLNGNESPDWLFTAEGQYRFTHTRIDSCNTHGTGCTLSAALAALRPRHHNWQESVQTAKDYLQQALVQASSLNVGKGNGPVHHFHQWW